MRKIGICLICLSSICELNAQSIEGRVVDKENNPIEFATIVLQTMDSLFINTTYSDSLGYFLFDENLEGYRLLVQHLMYKPIKREYASADIGIIEMEDKGFNLNEITVKGEHPLVRVVDGKLTYDMIQLLHNKMVSNAYDAILELPGVSEQDNAINLAGANGVTVIVNGKATTMSNDQLIVLLKNMPKERIQSAEIMYSTPPQYHVRGAAINLVLTNNLSETPQLQGQINGAYNQGHYASYKGGVALMYSTPRTSTDFIYSFDYSRVRNGLDIMSRHLYQGQVHNIEQHDRGGFRIPTHNMRLGNDWLLDEKNKISIVYTTQVQQWNHSFNKSDGTFSNSVNNKNSEKPVQMHNLALSYTSDFGLNIGADYTYYKNHTKQNYEEKMPGKEDAFTAQTKQDINKASFYADQSHQLEKDWTLTYGTKFSYASDNSSQIYHSTKEKDLSSSNSNSKLDEYTYNLYAGVSKSLSEKLSLATTLSGEYYKHKNIDYWSIFPTLEMTYMPTPTNIIQLSVSSDKHYPSYWEMQNAISYMNGYSEIHGNSDLKPSKNYSAQLNYILKQKYIFTLYTNYIDDNFNQLPYQSTDRLALIYKTLNFDYMAKMGLNVIIPFRVGEIIDSRIMLNGYYDKVRSNHFHDITFNRENLAFYSSLNNTFKILSNPNIKAELSGAYITKNIQGPMTISKMYKVDAGLKWTSNDSNAEINLKIDDMFNSWSPKDLIMDYKSQDLKMRMLPDSRRVSLSFSYKFGGFKEKKRKEVDSSRFGNK